MELIMQGAEGRVFTCDWLGKPSVVKQRFAKKYRHPDLDRHLTKERIKAEARALARCKMIGINVPTLYDVNLVSNEIVMELINNSLQVRKYIYQNSKVQTLMKELAEKIGSVVGKLHKNNIIHGDLTTSNMLLIPPYETSDIILIDFGLSYVSEQSEDKAVDLYVLERAILSTHPNSDTIVKTLLDSYSTAGGEFTKEVIDKLNEVRQRGRKKLCFG